MMKVYIAGPITNDPDYKDKFYDAEQALRYEGHTILNPSELPRGLTNADYMRIDLAMIDVADVVAFLPGWEESQGASLEHAYCQYISKQTMYLESYTPYQNIVDIVGYGF